MIPEIQATVREPVSKNMIKALNFQFTLGVVPMHAITYIGYWAYGSNSSSYLLNNVSGPVWLKGMANIAVFLQAIIALHIFASPMYEFLDTKYGVKGSALAFKNLDLFMILDICKSNLTGFFFLLGPSVGDDSGLVYAYDGNLKLGLLPATKRLLSAMQEKGMSPDFVLCIGDDRSDEDMFEVIMCSMSSPSMAPTAEVFACTVGRKPSKAKYYLDDTTEMVRLMQGLASVTEQMLPL